MAEDLEQEGPFYLVFWGDNKKSGNKKGSNKKGGVTFVGRSKDQAFLVAESTRVWWPGWRVGILEKADSHCRLLIDWPAKDLPLGASPSRT